MFDRKCTYVYKKKRQVTFRLAKKMFVINEKKLSLDSYEKVDI